MTKNGISRRNLFPVVAAGLGTLGLIDSVRGALAYQGNMARALSELRAALQSLRMATPDKGGHKATVIGLIEQAMGEVQAGIDFAASHFGD